MKYRRKEALYLRHDYFDGTSEYIGPFRNTTSAREHKINYGPKAARVVEKVSPDSVIASPEEHIAYIVERT